MNINRPVSGKTLKRLPLYINYLSSLNEATVSSSDIAAGLGLNPVQVRKDLGSIGFTGRPRLGYETGRLKAYLKSYLGGKRHGAVVVGLGRLGRALAAYPGFSDYGVEVVALFDVCKGVVGTKISNLQVLECGCLADVCSKRGARIGIITVPAQEAQGVCDRLVQGGVRVIWNFSAARLRVPEGLRVINEDIAASLALLCETMPTGVAQV